jgi:hypothetical protein
MKILQNEKAIFYAKFRIAKFRIHPTGLVTPLAKTITGNGSNSL